MTHVGTVVQRRMADPREAFVLCIVQQATAVGKLRLTFQQTVVPPRCSQQGNRCIKGNAAAVPNLKWLASCQACWSLTMADQMLDCVSHLLGMVCMETS